MDSISDPFAGQFPGSKSTGKARKKNWFSAAEEKEHLEVLKKYVSSKKSKKGSKAKELLTQAAENKKKRHSKRMRLLKGVAKSNPLHIPVKEKSNNKEETTKPVESRLVQLLTGPEEKSIDSPLDWTKLKNKNRRKLTKRELKRQEFDVKLDETLEEVDGDHTDKNMWVLKQFEEENTAVHKHIYSDLGLSTKRRKKKRVVI